MTDINLGYEIQFFAENNKPAKSNSMEPTHNSLFTTKSA